MNRESVMALDWALVNLKLFASEFLDDVFTSSFLGMSSLFFISGVSYYVLLIRIIDVVTGVLKYFTMVSLVCLLPNFC